MTTTGITCPTCGQSVLRLESMDATSGMVRCSSCGHEAFAGYIAEAGHLTGRMTWLSERIAAGDPAPDVGFARTYGIWDPRPTPAAAEAPRRGGLGLQTLLLSLGALLLVVAAVVFTAVAWPRLGPGGQLAVVAVGTGGVTAMAVLLRRRLYRTAETLAGLAFGLVVVDLVAAPGLGLLPEEWLDADSGYWLVALVVLAAVALLAGHGVGLRTWVWLGWVAVGAASGSAAVVLSNLLGGGSAALVGSVVIPALTGVLLVGLPWIRGDLSADRWPMLLVGTTCLAIAGSVTVGMATSGEAPAAATFTTAAITLVLLGLLWSTGWQAPAVFVVAAAVLAGTTTGMALSLGDAGSSAWVAAVVGLLGGAAVVAGVRRRGSAVGLLLSAPMWVAWLVLTSLEQGDDGVVVRAESQVSISVLLGVAAMSLLVAAWFGAGRIDVVWVAWPGVVVGYAALAVAAADNVPEVLEAWTLPGAALLLVAGLLTARGRDASSLETYGPALTLALLPSALATWQAPWVVAGSDDNGGHLVRLVIVLVVAGGLLVVGSQRQMLGLVLPSAAALIVAGGAQVWGGLAALPRWVALGLVGAVLLLAGARFEWVRGEGRRASRWAHQLT